MSLVKVRNRNGIHFPSHSNIWEDIFGKEHNEVSFQNKSKTLPAVNIVETNDLFRIDVAAPGYTKKDFNISSEKDILTISATQNQEETDKTDQFTRREFEYGDFKRNFNLPDSVDASKIKANYAEGVLKIELPKKETAKPLPPQQIKIN